jgi:DNA-binding MarR family transcriptional regulator
VRRVARAYAFWYGGAEMPFPPPAFVELQGVKLTPSARLVWLCLRLSGGAVRASEVEIAKNTGLTQATVHVALEQLQALGWVQVLEPQKGTRAATLLAVQQNNH